DVVRHRLVKQIIDAYEKHSEVPHVPRKEKNLNEKEDKESTSDLE
ncbi:MAG: Unknown protein, partial [uncultured Aureispira sp.]